MRRYARCQRLAREHYENFPVASLLLPSAMRPHIAAIYAFARTADDFADEPGVPDADRLRQLDDWRATARPCGAAGHSEAAGRRSGRRSSSRWRTRSASAACRRRCFTICSARFDRMCCRSATRPGTMCSTTAAAPPIRSAGSCCGSRGTIAATLDARSDEVCTALQLDELLAGSRARLAASAACTCPEQDRAQRRRDGRGSGRPTDDARVASGHGGDGAADTRALRRQAAPSATASEAACAGSCV